MTKITPVLENSKLVLLFANIVILHDYLQATTDICDCSVVKSKRNSDYKSPEFPLVLGYRQYKLLNETKLETTNTSYGS